MAERVGFIGLGAIGRPMAKHVVARFGATVWNRTAERAQRFAAETGATVAASAAALVGQSDVVITCLPTSRDVAAVVRDAGVPWRTGQLLIDATSGDPATSREIAAWLGQRGVSFVDAPVSGGTSGAAAGKLTVMLGGEAAAVARAHPVVETFAAKIVHVGGAGTGDALKAINNALLAVSIQAAGEGLAALVKLTAPLGNFDRVSVGFPGVVVHGETLSAPNLHEGWRHFPLAKELQKRVGEAEERLQHLAPSEGVMRRLPPKA